MGKINVGFIGLGRIADVHYPGYINNNQARLYAVCDRDEEKLRQRKEQWNIEKAYTDYMEMLQDDKLDAVEILTPQLLHENMVIQTAQAGKHIAVQKPMTINLMSADRMLDEVKKAGIVFKVTDNYTFYPPIVHLKKIIEDGTIGKPTNIRIKFTGGASGGWEVPPSAWEWRMKEKEAGRGIQTFDHGHHLWTTAWYLLGSVERVKAWVDSLDGIIDCPSVIIWKYKGRIAYGVCEFAQASNMHIPSRYYANDEWIEVTGTDGIAFIHRCTGNIHQGAVISVFDGHKWKRYDKINSDWGEGFIGATQNFIQAVRGDAKPLLSGEEGREILKLALSIQKSSRLRREVYPDEMDDKNPKAFTKKKIKQDIKKNCGKKGLLSWLGLGKKSAKYASKADELTEQLILDFNPDSVKTWNCIVGLHLKEEGNSCEAKYAFRIESGNLSHEKGVLPENYDILLEIPKGVWAMILLKKRRLETAFLQGKLKIKGKLEEALKLRSALGI